MKASEALEIAKRNKQYPYEERRQSSNLRDFIGALRGSIFSTIQKRSAEGETYCTVKIDPVDRNSRDMLEFLSFMRKHGYRAKIEYHKDDNYGTAWYGLEYADIHIRWDDDYDDEF